MAIDPERARRLNVWHHAIGLLDASEAQTRDIIERELHDIAGVNFLRIGEAEQAVARVMKRLKPIRKKAMADCFRYVRDNLPA
jgi:hypothetical protein